ncbi:hypothetical protein [Endozoicomonas sp. ONNA2]|uniref:hypothetical protein n=1 Tax=Endozoicomonas sp. ONNA2 TaxID=2828741 RepID=UPI002147ABD5|nr:hypothetical protein [Endozoicomonas sp. ONNA2]
MAKNRAVNILNDVNTFIRSTQTNSRDVQVLRKFLKERLVRSSGIGEICAFEQPGKKYAVQRTAQIITGVDSFLTSQHTTVDDRVMLRRLLKKNAFTNIPSGVSSNIHDAAHHTKKTEVLKHQKSGPLTTFDKLVKQYDKVVDGLYDYQLKRLTERLTHRGTFFSAERNVIFSKPKGPERAWSLLDTLTMQNARRPSLNVAASMFEEALGMVDPELARAVFHT